MRVLVCEDNMLMLKTIEFTLRKHGYDVFNAVDGEQGIRILDSEKIDILITDINMPYNSGLELIQHVKTNFDHDIPVIIVSGINLEEIKQQAKKLGAVNYVTKPFDPEVLVEMIKKISN
ncbi:MAG: response regulator [Bacteroidales bacterium]|nr:response regulator [Bacteroidales bacterium]MBN2699737.1 response regulator [Bacteroidales bacterium]